MLVKKRTSRGHPSQKLPDRSLKPNIQSLAARAHLLRKLRTFFDSRGFLEVQPPCLSRDCVVDAYLDPLEIDSSQFQIGDVDLPSKFFLQTSPESAMKRMLAAGAPSIYSLGPVFRAGERGSLHNIEFTMLEWYDVGAEMALGVELLGQLAAQLLGHQRHDVRSYRDLFRDAFALDPIEASLPQLCHEAEKIDANLVASIAADRDALLDLLFDRSIQPTLGLERPLIVVNYPLSQAALAKTSVDDPQCAARFELFAEGIELANGYDELRDPDTLLERYACNNARRVASGRSPLEVQSTLVDAMRDGLPQCTGVALGVDRLLMLQTGSRSIDEVISLPIGLA